MNPYDHPGGEPNFTLAVEKANSKWSRSSVKFVTAGPALHDEGRIARGEYFQPLRASNVPLAIILHGLKVAVAELADSSSNSYLTFLTEV